MENKKELGEKKWGGGEGGQQGRQNIVYNATEAREHTAGPAPGGRDDSWGPVARPKMMGPKHHGALLTENFLGPSTEMSTLWALSY